ncbi:MAG: deoxyhypusine synthase [Candidatus Nanoarchaeia archaeon]
MEERTKIKTSEVKDLELKKGLKISELVAQFETGGGFTAKKIALGAKILENMLKDKDCIKILSLPAAPIATGMRGIVKELVKRKLFDVVITTCGLLDHDLARTFKPYLEGDFALNDTELHKKGLFRLGSVVIPKESYADVIEEKMQALLHTLVEKGRTSISSYELSWEIGASLEKEPNKESSILYWAWKNKIPIFVPGLTDGAVGSQIWLFSNKTQFKIDPLADEQKLAELIFDAKKLGALMIGGGISKHHTIWWAQFKSGLDYAVYITTAPEWDGSLSGAQTREAISWGKLKERAPHITIEGEATVLLPLLISAVLDKLDDKTKV